MRLYGRQPACYAMAEPPETMSAPYGLGCPIVAATYVSRSTCEPPTIASSPSAAKRTQALLVPS